MPLNGFCLDLWRYINVVPVLLYTMVIDSLLFNNKRLLKIIYIYIYIYIYVIADDHKQNQGSEKGSTHSPQKTT